MRTLKGMLILLSVLIAAGLACWGAVYVLSTPEVPLVFWLVYGPYLLVATLYVGFWLLYGVIRIVEWLWNAILQPAADAIDRAVDEAVARNRRH